jgi:hypothetical protein
VLRSVLFVAMLLTVIGASGRAHAQDADAGGPTYSLGRTQSETRRSRAVASVATICAKRSPKPLASVGARGLKVLVEGGSPEERSEAANVLARQIGQRVETVKLAAIVGKYIGETEKNLAKLLARAERSDVVLFLDEADALLGKRTDVKDAHDRFASDDTRLVLERLRSHEGLVVFGHAPRMDEKARTETARRFHAVVRANAKPDELWTAICGG